MAKTIADQFVAFGLVTAEHAKEVLKEDATENDPESPEAIVSRKNRKANKVPKSPNQRKCVACGINYEYIRRGEYPGKSLKRCPECQLKLKAFVGLVNPKGRPMGHKTRQQHKRTHPRR